MCVVFHEAFHDSTHSGADFGNVALALLRLRDLGQIQSALVVDFDQHTADGTLDLLRAWPEARVLNPHGNNLTIRPAKHRRPGT